MLKIYALNITFLKDKDAFNKALFLLPEHRKPVLEQITHDHSRLCSVGAGLLLRYGFKEYGLDVNDFHFSRTDNGKPYAVEPHAPHFNISHSGDYAVCAFSDYDVGVDVQRVVPVSQELLDYVCTEDESPRIKALPTGSRADAFSRLWTRKESLIKLLGSSVFKLRHASLSLDGDALSATGYDVRFFEFSFKGYKLTACSGDDTVCDGVTIIHPEDIFDE